MCHLNAPCGYDASNYRLIKETIVVKNTQNNKHTNYHLVIRCCANRIMIPKT